MTPSVPEAAETYTYFFTNCQSYPTHENLGSADDGIFLKDGASLLTICPTHSGKRERWKGGRDSTVLVPSGSAVLKLMSSTGAVEAILLLPPDGGLTRETVLSAITASGDGITVSDGGEVKSKQRGGSGYWSQVQNSARLF